MGRVFTCGGAYIRVAYMWSSTSFNKNLRGAYMQRGEGVGYRGRNAVYVNILSSRIVKSYTK